MHHHTFIHRRPARVIDLDGNLFNHFPPPPSWSLVTNPDPAARAKLRINRNEYALAASCTPDPDDNVYRTAEGTTIVSSVDDNHTVTTVPTGPLAHANLTFDRRLARKTRTRKEHQELRDTWNYITRFAFHSVGASTIIVEEEPVPF